MLNERQNKIPPTNSAYATQLSVLSDVTKLIKPKETNRKLYPLKRKYFLFTVHVAFPFVPMVNI
ncbi:hypothetical protein LDE05_15650 [Lactobacillus delbrueckii subsp. bulgaricus]|nr:hypothetical protein LDE05_15650 [Lactobacillus delbrueckii subsp. bulgaricus]